MVKEKKKKKSFWKVILIIVAILFVILIISALLDDEEYSEENAGAEYTENGYTDNGSGDNGNSQSVGGVEYVVQDPVGVYRKFNAKVADASSEEINELASGRHFINQAFDFTEYATTINDSHSGNWGIYIYICGSDLESGGGAATEDINEILNASLPDDSNVVIQAGGANSWNMNVDPNYLQRFVYDGSSFDLVDSGNLVNMGEQKTVEDFLQFCRSNYPADNEVVIFWDHGGASVSGACYDEIFDGDHLTLNEIDAAFSSVYGKDRIEMVGFDCCLMATLDTAELLRNHAEMLVASEELEPGNGWYYTDWLNDLASDPSMSNAKLGKAICDSFLGGCQMYGTDDEATLSAIDLTQVNLVTGAMNAIGAELLGKATSGDTDVFATYGRAAQKSENYGGNNESSGYFDMVDLGDLMDQCGGALDSESFARYALKRAVVYNVHGSYRSESTGISVFYPYDKAEDNMQKIEAVTASDIYTSAMRYAITGQLSQETVDLIGMYNEKIQDFSAIAAASTTEGDNNASDDYLNDDSSNDDAQEYDDSEYDYYYEDDSYYDEYRQIATKSFKPAQVSADKLGDIADTLTFKNDGKDLEISVDDEGYITTDIGKNIDAVESVICDFLMYDEANDTYIALGFDNDVEVDWDNGVIRDNFRGVWASLGGHRMYLDIVYEGDDYNLYSVPVKVNGKDMDMSISYEYKTESYKVLGLQDSVDTSASNVSANRVTAKLKSGDKITFIGYIFDYEADDWNETELDTFVYSDDMEITEEDLGDGQFAIMFITTDVAGNEVFSQYGYIDYYGGEIQAYTEDEMDETEE
ncbi:MAG: hypothetical protein KBS96_09060 [Lachnospiraceae bacterium]|nr:hypothetical protein [Candidatus Colinaster scatohippi]